jgi:hypothetical protein
VALDDCGGDIAELAAVVLRLVAQHPEGLVGVDRVAGHQDPLCLLDHRSATERSLQVVVLGEALQRDVDRALQLLRGGVDQVSEDAAFGCLADISRVLGGEQRDHGAAGFVDDLLDQLESMLRRETEPDERDVGLFPRGHRSDCRDVDLTGDHLVPEARDYLGEQLEAVATLVGDQDAQMLNLFLDHAPVLLATIPTRMVDAESHGGNVSDTRFARDRERLDLDSAWTSR